MPPAISPAASASISSNQIISAATNLSAIDLHLAAEHAFGAVRSALVFSQAQPELPDALPQSRSALLAAAELVAKLSKRSPNDPMVARSRELIREVNVSGIHDTAVTPELLSAARRFSIQSWPGLLAAMLLVPSWQWPDAPALESAPDWLWSDYSAWLFSAPQGFCEIGHAELYANHVQKRLDELVRWVDRNAGSVAVRSALEAYLRNASGIPLYFSEQSLRRHAELRGRLLTRAFGKDAEAYDPYAEPRSGRKLRVGFVNRHFGSQTETYTTLPTFEQLDSERFEVILFAHHENSSPLETYARSRAKEFNLLSGTVADQVATLRGAALDVVVFGTNVTAVCNEVTLLALHRVAPLQVVNNSSCITSGLPEIDLYVSGTLTESPEAETHFSERLGLLPGPAHAFNYEADRQEPTMGWKRDAAGIPTDAIVFVSAANYFKIIPEMQHAWAKLLAAVPNSYLLVHPFNPNWSSSYPIQRFCAEFDRVLAQHGVDGSRFIVSTTRFPSRSDVKELLRAGDVYLDTYPFGGVNSLVDPLELGLPVVVWEGSTFRSRMGSALLRSLGLNEFIASHFADYKGKAVALAQDAPRRHAVGQQIRTAMERQPIFLDPLAASDAFGALLETAYDEVAANGRAAFRAERKPLVASISTVSGFTLPDPLTEAQSALLLSPNDATARHRVGRALLDIGRFARAADYLLAAVQHDENNAELWFDLATAFRQNGQMQHAIQSLEVSLRRDQSRLEAWIMLAELAKAVQSHELTKQAVSVAKQLSPHDPRLAAFG